MGLEDIHNPLKISLFAQFVAAGPEGGSRCVSQPANGLLGLFGEVDQVLLENSENPVQAPVDFLDTTVVKRFFNNTSQTGVDDSGWSTALRYKYVSCQFFCHCYSNLKIKTDTV